MGFRQKGTIYYVLYRPRLVSFSTLPYRSEALMAWTGRWMLIDCTRSGVRL